MTNTQRNTLVLGILLIFLLVFGISVSRNYSKKSNDLLAKNKDLKSKIAALDYQLSKIDSLRYQYEMQQELLAQQSKIIINNDSPTITYQYLLKLLKWMGRSIPFDFAMAEGKKDDTSWNEYVVSGRTNYRDLLYLTHNIEHQRAVLTIEELTIGADGVANSDTVSFSMIFRTHFREGGSEAADLTKKDVPPLYTGYSVFNSRIYETPPPREYDPALLAVDAAVMIAMTENRIFVRDEQKVIRILAVGDKVRDGYLYSIDTVNGKAVFKLNQYGVYENHTIFLNQPK
ncbi:MAG TPA: hypothetical protein PL124_10245 [Candidatus Cloacimonadota bacterium]|nr:hypothetical protein [Candidatus Cloacimonadota bacterium]HPS39781.1 hypothetical protein [Candidatus Cloacimonadota bacterium]